MSLRILLGGVALPSSRTICPRRLSPPPASPSGPARRWAPPTTGTRCLATCRATGLSSVNAADASGPANVAESHRPVAAFFRVGFFPTADPCPAGRGIESWCGPVG